MKVASLTENLVYAENKPVINILLQTENSKEIRIVFKKGQVMKEHQTPFPIIIEVYSGAIDFGVSGGRKLLKAGSLINLTSGVPHDLTAMEDSIVRLSLSIADSVERVQSIKNK